MGSFRDRFFTRPVAQSITSPSAILATGGGAAVGMLAAGPIGAVIGGVVGFVTRVGLAIPRPSSGDRIDAYRLDEPWRRMVLDAVAAQQQYVAAVRRARAGPLRDRLAALDERLTDGVQQCWRTALAGHDLAEARGRIDAIGAQRDLDELHQQGSTDDTAARTEAAIRSQLETAARMDATIARTRDELRLLNARLDEAVTRAIELSASVGTGAALDGVGADLGSITDEMEALRHGLDVAQQAGGT